MTTSDTDVATLADQLRGILAAVEADELDAEPAQVAYLRGAADAARVIAGQTDVPARSNAA